jgi:hypothetical protein
MALIVTSPRCHQFEQVLVAKHQAAVVHLQVSLEAGGEPEVDVAQPVRAQAVVSLTGTGHRHCRRARVTGLKRETVPLVGGPTDDGRRARKTLK